MANAKVLAKKQSEVEVYKEKFEKSKLIILTDYRGINVDDVTKIRAELRKTDCEYTVIENRREAIGFALKNAKSGDCIILAGKGHETYQIIGKTKNHFDEREVVSQWLSEIKN